VFGPQGSQVAATTSKRGSGTVVPLRPPPASSPEPNVEDPFAELAQELAAEQRSVAVGNNGRGVQQAAGAEGVELGITDITMDLIPVEERLTAPEPIPVEAELPPPPEVE